MVFKQPDYQELQAWRPGLQEWNRLTAIWLNIPLQDITMPSKFITADVIVGPISADQTQARKEKRFTKQGDESQTVFVSHQSCQSLTQSLVGIVFLEHRMITPAEY